MNNLKILVVDDEQIVRETLREQFELEGAVVSEAENGNIAFDLIQKNSYDLVVADVRMPECSGVELLEKIRAYSGNAPEVIMISGFTDLTIERARELGAKGLLMKPEAMANLKEMILETLED